MLDTPPLEMRLPFVASGQSRSYNCDMPIYTRTGDDGSTGLFGGKRVLKSELRLECCGTIDELNAAIGLAAVTAEEALIERLRGVQQDLFVVAAHLATPPEQSAASLPVLAEELVQRLERQIDVAQTELPKLGQFILPGGKEAGARLHLARTICRRAERAAVALTAQQPVAPLILVYLNRLSDWLFVHARLANHRAGVGDIPWSKPD